MPLFSRHINVVQGAGRGAALGLGFLVLGALQLGVRAVAGRPAAWPTPGERALVPLALAGFAAAGIVAAVLSGLRHSLGGAALVGFLAALPVTAAVGLALRYGGADGGWALALSAAAWAIVLGPIVGMRWLRTPEARPRFNLSLVPRLRTVRPPAGRAPGD
jgi:hypothetical protein